MERTTPRHATRAADRAAEWQVVRDASGLAAPDPATAAPTPALTRREAQVLQLVQRGDTADEVAAALGIRPTTVNKYKQQALEKLAARNHAHAAALRTSVTATVAIGDDHVREAVAAVLTAGGVTVTARVAHLRDVADGPHEGAVVVAELADDGTVDLAHVLPQLLRRGMRVVALVPQADPEHMIRALLAGAAGCLVAPSASGDEIVRTVHTVAAGGAALHPAAAAAVLSQWRSTRHAETTPAPADAPVLTDREREVLLMLADGLSTKASASRLGLSTKTVEHHRGRLFAKLGARNQAHAVARARDLGLLGRD